MEISPGKGASIGGPPTPSQEEIERTGATRNAMVSLGIMPAGQFDSQSIADIGKQTTWKYQGDATKPTIPPLRSLPLARAWIERDKEWVGEFQHLLDLLPEDIRERYLLESSLPVEERDPSYAHLDAFLGMVATLLSWIKKVSHPGEVSASAQARISANNALADQMRQAMIVVGKELIASAKEILDAMGHNDPHFDALSLHLRQLDAALDDLAFQEGETLSPLIRDLHQWSAQLGERDFGERLMMLHTLSSVLSFLAAAESIETGAASVVLSLAIANIGIEGTDSMIGIIPERLLVLRDHLIAQLLTIMPGADEAGKALLTTLTSALILGSITLTALNGEMESTSSLGLMAQFILSSDLLPALCSSIVVACGAGDATSSAASDLLALTAVILMLQTMSGINREQALNFIEGIQGTLKSWLSNVETIFSHEVSGPGAKMAILLQSAKIALEGEDFESFLDVLEEFGEIEPLNDHEAEIQKFKDIEKNLKEFIALMQRYLLDTQEEDKTHANITVFLG